MGWSKQGKDERVVLITGATTGIGLALARLLLKKDFRLVLTARPASLVRFKDLGIAEGPRVMLRPLDVAAPKCGAPIIAEINERWGGVDVLVNNAGILYRAVVEHLEDAHEEDQFHTNYLGPLHLIRLVLPHMRQKRSGHIINLSSVGGMMAMPTMGGYSASKFALEGASEALWYEMRPWGVRVTLIEPGFVNSDGFRHAIYTERSCTAAKDERDPYHAYYDNLVSFIAKMMTHSPSRAEDIATKILKTMNQADPPLRRPATLDAWFFSLLRRLLPQSLYLRVLYMGLPGIRKWVPKAKTKD